MDTCGGLKWLLIRCWESWQLRAFGRGGNAQGVSLESEVEGAMREMARLVEEGESDL